MTANRTHGRPPALAQAHATAPLDTLGPQGPRLYVCRQPVGAAAEDTVQHQAVKVNVEVGSGSESLDALRHRRDPRRP